MFFARIYDTTGKDDGLQGCVADVWEADSRAALDAQVGPEVAWQFIEADAILAALAAQAKEGERPRDIRGWRYENGQFVDPEG